MASKFARRSSLAFCAPIFVCFAAGVFSQACADEKGKMNLEAVLNAWKQRQSRVSTFEFTVAATEFKRATVLPEQAIIMGGQVPKNGPLSLPDTTTPVKIHLVVDASRRARLDHSGTKWSVEKNGYVPSEATDIFDGKYQKLLIPYGTQDHPCGDLGEGTGIEIARNVRFSPIGMVYRPLDKTLGIFNANKLELTPNTGLLDGQRVCPILKHPEDTPGAEDLVWVDPSRDFVPVRFYEIYRGVTVISIEIKYSSDPEFGWVPSSWKFAWLLEKGEVRESMNCKVTHMISINQYQTILSIFNSRRAPW